MTSTVDAESITALAEDTTRLLTAMPDAVIVCDKTGRIVFANTNVTHLLGYEPEELKGERVEILVPGVARAHHPDRRERYMRQSVTRPMSAGGDLEASHKSGNTIPVSISLSPLTEAGQAFVIAAIRDETKAREVSVALARECGRAGSACRPEPRHQYLPGHQAGLRPFVGANRAFHPVRPNRLLQFRRGTPDVHRYLRRWIGARR